MVVSPTLRELFFFLLIRQQVQAADTFHVRILEAGKLFLLSVVNYPRPLALSH